MIAFFKFLVFCFIFFPLMIGVITPEAEAGRFMSRFEDCEGVHVASIATALIALGYASFGQGEKFFESAEMMVVAATISFEVVYAYTLGRHRSRKRRAGTVLVALILFALAGLRVYFKIPEELNLHTETGSTVLLLLGAPPESASSAWIPYLYVTQAVIWVAAFVVAFSSKLRERGASAAD